MRIFLTRIFARFARSERIPDRVLRDAVKRAEAGLVDADLGGGVIKQRVARPGSGKSGGYRTIILFRRGDRAFFVYGFAKNVRDNVTLHELKVYKKLAFPMLNYTEAQLSAGIAANEFEEIASDG